MIQLNNVSYKYHERFALKHINLSINKGESVVLIGQNGCGKSTLLRILNGLYFAQNGEYVFLNEVINEKKMQNKQFTYFFHKQIGYLFQDSNVQLFCSTVEEEIGFGPKQIGLDEEALQNRVDDLIKALHLETIKDCIPYQLSGGEKKKVALAAVLANNPQVLTLDEPLSGLDPKTRQQVHKLLLQLKEAGKTIICATHQFDVLAHLFDRAIVFSETHEIVRDDSFEAVVKDKEFLREHNII